eukprot:7565064-Alexandrium_andersonii.AAC.1
MGSLPSLLMPPSTALALAVNVLPHGLPLTQRWAPRSLAPLATGIAPCMPGHTLLASAFLVLAQVAWFSDFFKETVAPMSRK